MMLLIVTVLQSYRTFGKLDVLDEIDDFQVGFAVNADAGVNVYAGVYDDTLMAMAAIMIWITLMLMLLTFALGNSWLTNGRPSRTDDLSGI